jgi:hypothetical protein
MGELGELGELATALMSREGRGETPFGFYVIRSDESFAELGRAIEREVFFDFFGNTPELLHQEYDPYEGASLFLVVIDHLRRLPAAVVRMILPSPIGFKSLHDIAKVWGVPADEAIESTGSSFDLDSVWDIATLAVSREYRGAASHGLVSLGLYQGMNMLGTLVDVRHAIAILDLVVYDLVQKSFHRAFSPFPGLEPRRYLDSPSSLPIWCDTHAYRARLALIDADMYELLYAGVGLEAVISSPLHGIDSEIDERWFQIA